MATRKTGWHYFRQAPYEDDDPTGGNDIRVDPSNPSIGPALDGHKIKIPRPVLPAFKIPSQWKFWKRKKDEDKIKEFTENGKGGKRNGKRGKGDDGKVISRKE